MYIQTMYVRRIASTRIILIKQLLEGPRIRASNTTHSVT